MAVFCWGRLAARGGLFYLGFQQGADGDRVHVPFGALRGRGAVLAILPFAMEYRVAARLAEGKALTTAVDTIENLQKIGT